MLALRGFAVDGVVWALVAGAKEFDFTLGVGAVDRTVRAAPARAETVDGALSENSVQERGGEFDSCVGNVSSNSLKEWLWRARGRHTFMRDSFSRDVHDPNACYTNAYCDSVLLHLVAACSFSECL